MDEVRKPLKAVTVDEIREKYPTLKIDNLPEGYLEARLEIANASDEGQLSLLHAFDAVTGYGKRDATLLTDFAKHSFMFENNLFTGGIIYYAPTGQWDVHT